MPQAVPHGWDWNTVILSASAIVQALALIITIIVMIRTARRQLRAYVFLDSVGVIDGSQRTKPEYQELEETDPADTENNRPAAFWSVKNFGSTPAYDVKHWGQIDVIEVRHEHALVVHALTNIDHTTHIAPGAASTKSLWFDRQLTPQEIADVRSNVRAIYVYGRIEYRDAFRVRHFTNYKMRYSGAYPPPNNLTVLYCATGNESGVISRFRK